VLGEDAKAEANFQRALQIAPQDSDIRHNWGWYLCTHGRAQASIAEFEQAVKNPLYKTPEIALVNAGRCSASLGDVAGADQFFKRALAAAPGNPAAAYGLALLAYRGGRYDEARGWLRPAVLQANPAPEALYLGVCLERKLNDKQAEMSYASQLRNRYPDAAETRALPSGVCE
jgi:type IV pilus assembly protein PilF